MLATALLVIAGPAMSQSVDRGRVSRIIDQGTTRGQVMPAQSLVIDAQTCRDDDD